MADQPSYPGMEPAPRRSHLPLVLGIVAVLILIIIGGLVWLNAAPGGVQGVAAALKVPAELKQAYFAGGTAPHSTLYQATWHGFTALSSPQIRWAGSASPDGSFITGVVQNGTSTLVFVQKPGTADRTYIALGTGPGFLDATHVAYFTHGGFVVYDLATKNAQLVYAVKANPIGITYSPDRSLVAWTDAVTTQTIVARITPTSYQPLHVFQGIGSVTAANNGVYVVRENELWNYSLAGEGQKVLAFPKTLAISRIIL